MAQPTKRSSLETLKRPRLIEIAQAFDVEVSSRAKHEELVDALVAARTVRLEEASGTLSRDELKAICDAHELDRSGRGKAPIVARILGHESDPSPPGGAKPTERGGTKRTRRKAKAAEGANNADGNGGVLGFKQELWGMADQRWTNSAMPPAEYSTPILALIFLKYGDHKYAQVEGELAAKQREDLPEHACPDDLFEEKYAVVCEHVYESYNGHETGKYEAVQAA